MHSFTLPALTCFLEPDMTVVVSQRESIALKWIHVEVIESHECFATRPPVLITGLGVGLFRIAVLLIYLAVLIQAKLSRTVFRGCQGLSFSSLDCPVRELRLVVTPYSLVSVLDSFQSFNKPCISPLPLGGGGVKS